MDKSLMETIKESVSNVLYSIKEVLKKYKKYIFIVIIICLLGFGAMAIINYVKEQKDKVYLSDKIKETLNCKETNSCVFTNNTSNNNYVWYSGFLWRIVKINDDGSIKLILNESVGIVNHYNGLNNDYLESFIRLWLNEGIFLNGLNSPDTFITDYSFCYGDESNECKSTVKDKVGLLTYSEYETSGGKESYLNIGIPFWTITSKKDTDQDTFIVDENGELKQVNTKEYYQIRPVINLNSKIMIDPLTKGASDNPYVLRGDESSEQNSYLRNRYTGEYIKFAGKVWRIAEVNENYTKLVLYGKDTKMKFGPNNIYAERENEISEFLGNIYYNILKGALPEIDRYLYNGTFYGGKLSRGDAYTNVRIEDSSYRNTMSNIGILSLGELFSGNDLNLTDDNITWTMTPSGEEEGKLWLSNGASAKFDLEYAVRPVVYLEKDVYVVGGSGDGRTRETAYEISIR